MSEAIKYDSGKDPIALLDPGFLIAVSKVLGFGADKYEPWNWAKGTFSFSRLYSAHQRHMLAFWSGEELDPETGLPHLDHAACCLMFLRRYAADGMGTDDRHRFGAATDVPRVQFVSKDELISTLITRLKQAEEDKKAVDASLGHDGPSRGIFEPPGASAFIDPARVGELRINEPVPGVYDPEQVKAPVIRDKPPGTPTWEVEELTDRK